MEFYTQNGYSRPSRCSEETRKFAFESMNGKYGREALTNLSIDLDDEKGYENLSDVERYDLAIKRIAERAPIRICEGEKLSGAATLGGAIYHNVPANRDGKVIFQSVSHLTIDFETAIKFGVNEIESRAKLSFEKYRGTEKEPFARSCVNCLQAMKVWRERYLNELKRLGYEENYRVLSRVPFEPARSFREAVQSLWFTFAFVRLCGNWPGIGRIDYLLGDYLKRDLESGEITLDEARELLAHFFIKGCEWANGTIIGSGDAQHYQNLVLGGVDENGDEVTNEVTYLVLDVIEEFGISDFPTTVRLNSRSDERLIKRVAEVTRYGGGILAVYDEDLILSALTEYGYDERTARRFANDGCWEVQIPGETFFSYYPFDALQILQRATFKEYSGEATFDSFEDLYERYIADLTAYLDGIFAERKSLFVSDDGGDRVWKPQRPCTVVSLFERGCVERGLSYLEGGPNYNVYSPHLGGLADAVNALYAVKKLVFDDKKVSLAELTRVLRDDWAGAEELRTLARDGYAYYGNDNDEVDEIAVRLLSDFAAACAALDGKIGYSFPAGVSTFGRQLEWSPSRLACPHGRKKGEVLAANTSPTPCTDREGVTSTIKSYCKIDLKKLVNGAALDVRLLPSSVKGEKGLNALVGLTKSFLSLGGFFMQLDVVDADLLRAAQRNPNEYKTLSVRVSGWNARFVTLDKEWQDMVIAQNERG